MDRLPAIVRPRWPAHQKTYADPPAGCLPRCAPRVAGLASRALQDLNGLGKGGAVESPAHTQDPAIRQNNFDRTLGHSTLSVRNDPHGKKTRPRRLDPASQALKRVPVPIS